MSWLHKKKDRLVLLLGAGSTIHAGAPKTAEITCHVRSLTTPPSLKLVINGLKTQRGTDGFNFETIIYAFEELDAYLLRQQIPQAWSLIGGVLTAFTELVDAYAGLKGEPLLVDRLLLLASIAKFVADKTESAAVNDLRDFLDFLRSYFWLTVFTLNYDCIIDRSGKWFDGFCRRGCLPAPHLSFDPAGFQTKFESQTDGLAHLHGSVHFGQNDTGTEVVKYLKACDALDSLEHPDLNRPAPIISGFGKETKLARETIPFGYYYHAFVRALQSSPRLLVAGYGGLDPHVTSWISEHQRIHGSRTRNISIDLQNPPNAASSANLLYISGSFPPGDECTRDKILHFLRTT